jgi:O-acetyl-ADP-ribose deacetylase (regulator of RNase III)
MTDASEDSTIVGQHSEFAGQTRLRVGTYFRGLMTHGVLGEGAMGSAYLASHPVLQMPLVIKTFKTTLGANIFQEAHLAARVFSPNVVGVLDAGYEAGIAFVTQRYVDGIDLEELINYSRECHWRLSLNMVCHILIDAANGLHAIHQAGVIHRDIKPANLFLYGSGTATVGDFGIAFDPVKEGSTPFPAGTPMFMAPEQWEWGKPGRYTDIYALGATGHLLATGEFPFSGKDVMQLRQAHLHTPYVPPAITEPAEAYLFSAIERALRKSASERYSNAAAFARTLEVIAEPLPQIICTGECEARTGQLRLELIRGDLSEQQGEVIVNAANTELTMNLGVAKALRHVAGQQLEQEAMTHAPAAMGDVIWTSPGQLRARWVAHAVAANGGAVCLQRTTLRTLLGAEKRRATSVLFPALGTGVGDVPMDLAAKLMLEAVRTFAALQPRYVREVRIILYDDRALSRWCTIMHSM